MDEEWQGINLLNAVCVFRTQGVKADGIRTTPTMVPHIQMQLSRYNASRCSCQGTTRPDTAINAPSLRTQLPWHMPAGRGVSWESRSGCSVCLTDVEYQGKFLDDDYDGARRIGI